METAVRRGLLAVVAATLAAAQCPKPSDAHCTERGQTVNDGQGSCSENSLDSKSVHGKHELSMHEGLRECSSQPELVKALGSDGYCIIRQAFSGALAMRALEVFQRPGGMLRRDALLVRHSERVTQVLELDPVFGEILEGLPPWLYSVLESVLGADFHLGSFHALLLHPEARSSNASRVDEVLRANLHSDYPYGHATAFHGGNLSRVRQDWPQTMQLLWMLTDFTRDNGATLLLPASHRDGALPRRLGPESHADHARFKRDAVAATGSAGDLLVYSGQVWHSIGVNTEERPRAALLGQLLPFFIRPMEAHAWTLPMGVQAGLSSKVKRLLGINWHFFFQHSFRLAPLPRGPFSALWWLFDALWHGYPPNIHRKTLRQGVALAEMPAWAEELLLAAAPIWFQMHRWICLAALLIVPVAFHNCAWGRRLSVWTVSLLSLFIGLCIGNNLTLERLHM